MADHRRALHGSSHGMQRPSAFCKAYGATGRLGAATPVHRLIDCLGIALFPKRPLALSCQPLWRCRASYNRIKLLRTVPGTEKSGPQCTETLLMSKFGFYYWFISRGLGRALTESGFSNPGAFRRSLTARNRRQTGWESQQNLWPIASLGIVKLMSPPAQRCGKSRGRRPRKRLTGSIVVVNNAGFGFHRAFEK